MIYNNLDEMIEPEWWIQQLSKLRKLELWCPPLPTGTVQINAGAPFRFSYTGAIPLHKNSKFQLPKQTS